MLDLIQSGECNSHPLYVDNHNNIIILNSQQQSFHLVRPSLCPILVAFSVCLSLIFVVFELHEIPTDEC